MGYISVGPLADLTYIQAENILSVMNVKSDNNNKPFCLKIEFHNGKSKNVYFLSEDEAEKNLRKVKIEMEKVYKSNNFHTPKPEPIAPKKRSQTVSKASQ